MNYDDIDIEIKIRRKDGSYSIPYMGGLTGMIYYLMGHQEIGVSGVTQFRREINQIDFEEVEQTATEALRQQWKKDRGDI